MVNDNICCGKLHSACIITSIILFLSTGTVSASTPPVTADFLQKNGRDITVQLTAHSRVTGSVIFTVTLPQGVKLVKAEPRPGKYDHAAGRIKWLLRGLSPGSHEISLHLSSGVSAGSLNAEIRYLNPVTGKLCIIPVRR